MTIMQKTNSLLAIAVMSVGMLFIPLGDTAGKLLTGSHGAEPVFVAWSRFAIGAIFIWLVFGCRGFEFAILRDWRVWFRASLIVGGICSILTALRTEPIADVFGAFFVGPILSYFLSAWLLRERISLVRTALLFIGFCGVLLVVKPGINTSPGMLYALMAGSFYGGFLVASKWLAQIERPRSLLLSHLLIGALVLTPWGSTTIPDVTTEIVFLILLSAAASALGNLLLLVASRMADASRLSPLVYVQLVSATALGFLVFGDVPDYWSLLGLAMLLGSGFVSFVLVQSRPAEIQDGNDTARIDTNQGQGELPPVSKARKS